MVHSFFNNTLLFFGLFSLALVACNPNKNNSSGNSGAPPPNQEAPHKNPQDSKTDNQSKSKEEIDFQKFGIIREFGGTDNAALFGVYSKAGKFQITQVIGPTFLKTGRVGELNQASLDQLFINTTKPLSVREREDLISEFNGASFFYTESYSGNLCNIDEITYEIKATGRLNDLNIEVTFQFEALPNANGNCQFHVFGIITKYTN